MSVCEILDCRELAFVEWGSVCSRIDAACIDFDSRHLTNDAASIDVDSERNVRITRAQALDVACIDAETSASPIDERPHRP
jgi:hypothetical protein